MSPDVGMPRHPAGAGPRVTVVVPVYNPGLDIEPCIASLQRQTLGADQVEVIFVDDGSTDATPERLDAVAATHPNMRVIRIAPSGAPGRPRNTGMDAARGRYVLFLDADDELAPTALERLAAWADRHGSDVVIGKYASAARPRGQAMFGSNRARMNLRSNPALLDSSLGATKLFRLDLLRENGIRFPEGWRLMEDQFFVLRTYFRAQTISLLADRTYAYFRQRESGEHLSSQPLDLDADLAHLGELIDMIETEAGPGPLRERAIRRLYRAEILARLGDEAFLELDSAYRKELIARARAFATERVAVSIDAGLNPIARLRSALLREGRPDELLELARRLAGVELRALIRRAGWRHGQLRVAFSAHLANMATGQPVAILERGGTPYLDPTLTAGISAIDVAVDDELQAVRGNVQVRERDTAEEWVVPTRLTLRLRARPDDARDGLRQPVVMGLAHLDPQRIGAAGRPLAAGSWALNVRLNLLGIDQRAGLRAGSSAPAIEPAVVGDPPRLIQAGFEDGLRLDVQALEPAGPAGEVSSVRPLRDEGGPAKVFVAPLPIASDVGVKPLPAELVARQGGRIDSWPAVAHHRFGQLVLEARPGHRRPGRASLAVRLTGHDGEFAIGDATFDDGELRLVRSSMPGPRPAEGAIGWLAGRLLDEGRRRYEAVIREAMPLGRRVFEAAPRPLRAPILRLTRSLRR